MQDEIEKLTKDSPCYGLYFDPRTKDCMKCLVARRCDVLTNETEEEKVDWKECFERALTKKYTDINKKMSADKTFYGIGSVTRILYFNDGKIICDFNGKREEFKPVDNKESLEVILKKIKDSVKAGKK